MMDFYSPEHEEDLTERINFLGQTIGFTIKRMQNPRYGILLEYGPEQIGEALQSMKTERLALILQVETIQNFNKG